MMENISLVYMLAGMSSRFGGDDKHFAEVGPDGETLLEYSLDQGLAAGDFSKIVFIIREETLPKFLHKFEDDYKGVPIQYAFQIFDKDRRDKPWGTCDALSSVTGIHGPIILCNGDTIYDTDDFRTLFKHIENSKNDAAIGYKLKDSVPYEGAVNRSIFSIREGKLEGLVETVGITRINMDDREALCNQGLMVLYPQTLTKLYIANESFKQRHEGDRDKECWLPTELNNLIRQGEVTMDLYPAKGKCFGITNPDDADTVREVLKYG